LLPPSLAATFAKEQAALAVPACTPSQDHRAIGVPLTTVKTGAGRPPPGTQVGRSDRATACFVQIPKADSADSISRHPLQACILDDHVGDTAGLPSLTQRLSLRAAYFRIVRSTCDRKAHAAASVPAVASVLKRSQRA